MRSDRGPVGGLSSVRMAESSSVAEVFAGARDGDERAWNELVDRFSSTVWAIARGTGLSDAEASDAQAATWMKLLTRMDSIRSPERLPGWLRTTARNEAITIIRRRSRTDATAPDQFDRFISSDESPEDELEVAEDVALVRESLARLDQPCQELLRLLFGDLVLSYAEVSELLDLPVGSIGPTRQRCLQKLRSLI